MWVIMNKKHLIAYSILGVLTLLFFGITVHQCSNPKVEYIEKPKIVKETVIKDSIQIIEKVKWKYRTEHDTFFLPSDTIHDTIWMKIPIDHYEYRDSASTDSTKYTLGINYSGYKASLDSVWFNYSYVPKEVVKTKKNGWGYCVSIGPQIGYGATINTIDRTFISGPYIGVGVSIGWCYHW